MAAQSALLALLKLQLIISTTAYDTLLTQKLSAAKDMIAREGAILPDTENSYTAEDNELVVGYAAYLWRKGKADDTVFPRWLRYALNNRVLHDRAQQSGGDEDV